MPERNVELARRWVLAYNARDTEALTSCCDPRIEFHAVYAAVGGGVYHGHDGLRQFIRDVDDAWGDGSSLEPKTYFDVGAQTLAFYVFHTRGRQSGLETTMQLAQVARWRDGLCVYMRSYADRDEALAELGVSEDELEPIEP
jgi:ketosteroid isomerase-like protein